MTSYLVQGLLNNTTSLLIEGSSNSSVTDIKLFIYLNSFNIKSVTTVSIFSLINRTRLKELNINNKYIKLTILNKNKLVKYKIIKYSYLNKINVN